VNIDLRVPDGKSGDWEVSTFEVTKKDAELFNMQCLFSGIGNRGVIPGIYKKLTRNGTTIMSNTPAEINDHWELFYNAKGNILINGLGLGVCLQYLLDSNKIEHATIIEKSEDVINLVANTYQDERVTIINDDALTFKPPKGIRYDAVWHDIWDYICADNLSEMITLHRKYGRRTDWQGSWCRWLCEQQRDSTKNNRWSY
jgi:hypothetical protein